MTKQYIDKQNQGFASPSPLPRLGFGERCLERLAEVVGRALLVFLAALSLTSCSIEPETEVCEFNTRLTYIYNRENTAASVLPIYIKTLDEYIFNQQDVLVMINRLPGISCFGEYVSEFNLPAGKYTVITWGNKATPSKVNKEQIGVTTRQEMMLYLDNPQEDESLQNDSERLYYGYRTFSVNEYGVSKVRVDMSHAHCVLNITVQWRKMAEAPTAAQGYYMLLKDIPSGYSFMPQYKFQSGQTDVHDPMLDTYPANSSQDICYMPLVHAADNLVNHRTWAEMNTETRTLQSRFITYRYKDSSHELLSVYLDDTQIMKEIDLAVFFQSMGIVLDTNRRQEFDLLLVIDGNNVTVSLIKIDDWDEGGSLGGG